MPKLLCKLGGKPKQLLKFAIGAVLDSRFLANFALNLAEYFQQVKNYFFVTV